MEIISEKNYNSSMETLAVPTLARYRERSCFDPDGRGTVYYEKYLPKQAKGVILIVHGFTETAEKYTEIIYYFLEAGYRVYIPDLRGHGRSARDVDDLSMVYIDSYGSYIKDLVYLVEEIIQKENPLLPIYLFGHSMGGGIGASLLEQQPTLFSKAVLSSPMIRPLTGNIPFLIARAIADMACRLGHAKQYVPGQHEFRADERFEDSASTSRERYEYYYQKRQSEKLFQTSGASYAWLREASRLSAYILKKKNCKKICTKILMFQAAQDDFVDCRQQNRFADRTDGVILVPMKGTKHEIYMSRDDTIKEYMERILAFLQ